MLCDDEAPFARSDDGFRRGQYSRQNMPTSCPKTKARDVTSASFVAKTSASSPRKLFVSIILKKKAGSKYPKYI